MFLILMDAADYEYVELYLDSKDSVNFNSQTKLQDRNVAMFQLENIENIAAFKVLQAEIPFSYLIIRGDPDENGIYMNQFTLQETGFALQYVTIPPGNYTATDLATTLGLRLTAASASPGGAGVVYTVTYNAEKRGEFVITAASGSFELNGMTQEMLDILGLRYNGENSGIFSVIRTNTVSVTGANYLYINSFKMGSLIQTRLPQNAANGLNVGRGPQIAKIPVNVNFWNVVFYNDPMPTRWFYTENLGKLDSLDLYCTLGNSTQVLDFRGLSFSVKIGLLLYRPNLSQTRRG